MTATPRAAATHRAHHHRRNTCPFRSRPAPRVATPFPLPRAGSSSTRFRSPGRLTDRFAGRLLSADLRCLRVERDAAHQRLSASSLAKVEQAPSGSNAEVSADPRGRLLRATCSSLNRPHQAVRDRCSGTKGAVLRRRFGPRRESCTPRPLRKPRSARAWCPRSWWSSSAAVSRPTLLRLAPPAAGLALGRVAVGQSNAA